MEENEKYVEKGGVESDDDEAIESDDDGSDIDEDDENEKEMETYEKLKKSL